MRITLPEHPGYLGMITFQEQPSKSCFANYNNDPDTHMKNIFFTLTDFSPKYDLKIV